MNKPYPNLEAEMARYGVKQKDIAELLKKRTATISEKMNGKSKFDIDEAYAIKKAFFPNCMLDYLFNRESVVA